MALPALSRHCKHHVFPSFHGEDVRRGLLSFLLKELREKGIDVYIDNDMERSKSIGPELTKAIRGSLIAVVLISRNYGSSTWCLNELVEIMKCRDEDNQRVMVIFYQVEPSDVKKQTGYFGAVFEKTCAGKTTEEVERWREALQEVATLAGYDSLKCDSDAVMIETIATDISNKLNDSTAHDDINSFVGIETHIREMDSLLSLESDEVRMVGVWGPAGIGKTTIARALYRKLSTEFTHTTFIERVSTGKFEKYHQENEHEFMLHLQEQLLSKALNQKDLKINHLGVAKARLKDKKVLVVLDDVEELKQLEAMTNKTCWFGPGSRIVITTKDKKLLNAHDINNIYQVGFPSTCEALEILCMFAFRRKSPLLGFEDMALEVTQLAGNLPLGLRVFGSYLRGMSKDQWIHALPRLRTSLDGGILKVLRFSYDALCGKDRELFLHVACFFNGEWFSNLVEYLAESRLDVSHGLQVLVDRSLILINEEGRVLMHNLLEKLGKEIVRQSVYEPGKRQFLVDPQEICDVLVENEGTGAIRGIDFDLAEMREEMVIHERAFERMYSLQFLRFRGLDINSKLLLPPQGLKFRAGKLRFLKWDQYPLTCFPREFHPQRLVKLKMRHSNLEKLWDGPIPLPCLKLLNLHGATNLKEVPDLSNATSLEVLDVAFCTSLVKIMSSIGNATNLKKLNVSMCLSLVEIPSSIRRLKRLKKLIMGGWPKLNHLGSQLKTYPNVLATITKLGLSNTVVEEFFSSVMTFSCLLELTTVTGQSLKVFPDVPDMIEVLELHNMGIEEVPAWIQNLSCLTRLSMPRCYELSILPTDINLKSLSSLNLSSCKRLKRFPEISTSIEYLSLRETAIEQVPSSVWSWSRLRELDLEDCSSLQVFHNGTDSSDGGLPLRINLKGCKNLVSLPHIPYCVSFLDASNCDALERLDGFFANPERCLIFGNCFKLSQEARELIQMLDCKLALLPGEKLPEDYDHRARERPLPLFFRFKACILLLHGLYEDDNEDEDEDDEWMGGKRLSCHIWCVQNGVDIGHGSCKYHLPAMFGSKEHLYFFESSIFLNFFETHVKFSELHFEFKITGQYWDIKDFGVKLLEDSGLGRCGNIYNEGAEFRESADIKIEKNLHTGTMRTRNKCQSQTQAL